MDHRQDSVLEGLDQDNNMLTNTITRAYSLKNHPMLRTKKKLRAKYYYTLQYLVTAHTDDRDYTDARLLQCRKVLLGTDALTLETKRKHNNVWRRIVSDFLKPWRRKYRSWLFCDLALILFNEQSIAKVQKQLLAHLNPKQTLEIKKISALLYDDTPIPCTYTFAESMITQFRSNRTFDSQTEKRYLVTANMSAGKSTLINAIIGKPMMATAQEACTANVCFLYNKPFEDNALHLLGPSLNLQATYQVLRQPEQINTRHIASYFRSWNQPAKRICLVDTPGVNSAVHRQHGRLTKTALMEEPCHYLIYVLNANRLGTEEELRYLQFVANTVSKDKIIFVLNKLDSFKQQEDSIEESIEAVRNDLMSLGYQKPLICPISAYFAFLIKMKYHREPLTEEENDEYELYAKKFSKPAYDLSRYYEQSSVPDTVANEMMELAIKCGLYGLEKILYEEKCPR